MTKIEWTDVTLNPVRGCTPVSEGCRNCFAQRQAHRFSGPGKAYEGLTRPTEHGPKWTGKVRLVPEKLDEPLRWRKPRRIFVNSMSDLFHASVPDEFIDRVFAVMALCPQHSFQCLTKRPERMLRWAKARERYSGAIWDAHIKAGGFAPAIGKLPRWPLPNVHLYVSVEDQATADERIPLLLQTPAAVRGVSLEPLLGPVVLRQQNPDGNWPSKAEQPDEVWLPHNDWPDDFGYWQAKAAGLSHVIVGGESGPGARPCNVEWIRSIVQQCRAAKVPVFCKQLGAMPVVTGSLAKLPQEWPTAKFVRRDPDGCPHNFRLKLQHRKGNDMAEWPADLRVQEMPAGNGGE